MLFERLHRNKRVVFSALFLLLLLLGIIFFPNSKEGGSDAAASLSQDQTKPGKLRRETDQAGTTREAIERSQKQGLEQLEALRNAPVSPSFPLLLGGRLSPDAARHAGLSDTERAEIESVVREMWEKASAEFRDRARYDREASDPAKQKWVYHIPASPDRGKVLREDLARDFKAIVGEERQRLLFTGLESFESLGAYGRFDVQLEFDGDAGKWKYERHDPDNGAVASLGEIDPLYLESHFELQFGAGFLEELEKKRLEN